MPSLFIFIPLALVIALNILGPRLSGRKTALISSALALIVQIIMSLTMGGKLWSKIDSALRIERIIGLRSNSYSPLMLFLIGLVALISLCVAADTSGVGIFNFTNLMLIAVMGMNGLVLVDDMFTMYVFLEITAVSTFILIAIRKGRRAMQSSFKYLYMSAVATVFILLAITLMLMYTGSLRFEDINGYFIGIKGTMPMPVLCSCILLITGLLIKAGLVPFHGWVADAYSSSPMPVSILIAGIETKVSGVYSLFIIYTSVLGKNPMVGNILMVFGVVSIIIGALAAIAQDDFKNMLAFSSISQIGYIILGIGIGTPLAIAGAAFHFFNHAIFKSLLFVNSAAVETQTGTVKFKKLGGLASRMPYTGITSILALLSTAGIPPLSGFWSKFMIIASAWQSGSRLYAAIALLSSILTLAYFLKMQRSVFFGRLAPGLEEVAEADNTFKYVSVILAAITVAVGVLFPFIAPSVF